MNGLAGCSVSTIGKPHEYFDLTRTRIDGKMASSEKQIDTYNICYSGIGAICSLFQTDGVSFG